MTDKRVRFNLVTRDSRGPGQKLAPNAELPPMDPPVDLESLFGPSRVTVTKRRIGYGIQIHDQGMSWLKPHWRPTLKSAERHARATAEQIRSAIEEKTTVVVFRIDV